LVDDDAPIDSDEVERFAVPVAADPVVIAPVAPFVAAPVVAVLAPMVDVDEVDVDAAGVPVELDVVLLPGAAVVLLLGVAVVVLLDVIPFEVPVVVLDVIPFEVPVVVPCAFVDVIVCAWSVVAPSRTTATATMIAVDGCRVLRAPRQIP